MIPIKIMINRLPHGKGLLLPKYSTKKSAGMDLSAAINSKITMTSGERALIPTGFSIAIPQGFEGQIRPRSGLSIKFGISVLNAPGTIDADYRGEIKVILINHDKENFVVKRGMRIAQLVISPNVQAIWEVKKTLPRSARGKLGFGSTGN
jgi:dUTP pyrophosphatase|tara:strand:- start:276 stop:725 length:450 start_codon:yes stop_codon:yes gene_type:complete